MYVCMYICIHTYTHTHKYLFIYLSIYFSININQSIYVTLLLRWLLVIATDYHDDGDAAAGGQVVDDGVGYSSGTSGSQEHNWRGGGSKNRGP